MNLGIASLSMVAVGLLAWSGCGGVAFVGDTEQQLPDGGSPVDSGRRSATDATPNHPSTDASVTQCAAWSGSCHGSAADCGTTETAYNADEHGCAGSTLCCAPRCYPTPPGCPPGMMVSPLANAICGLGTLACMPDRSECGTHGGNCVLDDGTALTDPCTASGRTLSAFACGSAKQECCLPK